MTKQHHNLPCLALPCLALPCLAGQSIAPSAASRNIIMKKKVVPLMGLFSREQDDLFVFSLPPAQAG